MLKIPLWKTILVVLTCVLSIYFSLPSFLQMTNKSEHSFLPSHKVNLGLDLRGGSYLLLKADFETYKKDQLKNVLEQLRLKLIGNHIRFNDLSIKSHKENCALAFTVNKFDPSQTENIRKAIFGTLGYNVEISENNGAFQIQLDNLLVEELKDNLLMQSIEIIRRRIDETGTREIDIQRQGEDTILLQVPGLHDPSELKRLLGKTAKLSFHMVNESVNTSSALKGKIPIGSKILPMISEKESAIRHFIVVKSRPIMTGDMLLDAQATVQQTSSSPVVNFKLNNIGGRIFGEVTSKHKGERMAIVLDNKVISAPVIRDAILSGDGVISGNFNVQAANELALLLRAGALPAPLKVVEERTVGPTLGQDSIEAGKKAIIGGVVLVTIFMWLFYGFFGLIANVALIMNLFVLIAVLALFNATLTLPGMAGAVLMLGMAVDANVLIFERIKEELRNGRTVLSAIESGYRLAFATIFDSNITTIFGALILYFMGSGPIKGFAVTLSIGILCSMFTAVLLTKIIVAKWYQIKKPKTLKL